MAAISVERMLGAILGPVELGDSRDTVRSKLGRPIEVVKINDFFGERWRYKGLDIYYYGEAPIVVGQIESTNPDYCTETNVCPGDSLEGASAKLGSPLGGGKLRDGDNTFLLARETCSLSVVMAKSKVKSLAMVCQL